jgi:pyruvate/2-oxoglutarate dehydrogenase complex dihydrolipoamide dehydrogenase (E3) component
LYSAGGRDGNSEGLNLDAVNVTTGRYGRIIVDDTYKTSSPLNIFAVGDINGLSGLASSAQYQARFVSDLLFREYAKKNDAPSSSVDADDSAYSDEFNDRDSIFMTNENGTPKDFNAKGEDFLPRKLSNAECMKSLFDINVVISIESMTEDEEFSLVQNLAKLKRESTLFGNSVPLTLWTVPEISSVGLTYDQAEQLYGNLTDYHIVQGYGYFKDMARGRLSGDIQGFLKIISLSSGKISQASQVCFCY